MEKITKPVRARRKEARPGEIIDVAIESFLSKGYEATKLDAVARQAGVAKGTVFLYFGTKEKLFRAVVQKVTESNFQKLRKTIDDYEGAFPDFLKLLLSSIVSSVSTSPAPAMAVMILRESKRFPDIGQIWFDEVLSPTLGSVQSVIEKAQNRGEVRPGDSRAHALSILGPMFTVAMIGEMVADVEHKMINRETLAHEHLKTVLNGLYLHQ
ncbi:TetR/AcrR family transcriptional regulator [Pectobacterium wasabiae]|uniref:TetR/AcrR family transcriptional regulator n=1 Tax=Pectobacterium wasabiae TaxID=55208 RepID=UPI00027B0C05|nr:TetR/AcrR family transcriptional regulator [Pectobacterium wasabiae]AOR61801.1 hypothetical protein A7983_00610 [Pectobacterium wasabiae CFBP 3304]EJS95128.1 TetR-like virulence regulator [Pectobacterium wasabiae CFBP 3304]